MPAMVTLCTFDSPVEAALAKSRLDDREISCTLADEHANRYGGAPLAIPIRLLVPEKQAKEARRVLSETGPELPADFDPAMSERPEKETEEKEQVLSEIRALRHANHWIGLGVVVILVITIYLLSELPRRATSPWSGVGEAARRYDYDKALALAKRISAQSPNDSYGHEYLGNIYLQMDNLEQAEAEYARALELSPPQILKQKLDDVRKRRARAEETPH